MRAPLCAVRGPRAPPGRRTAGGPRCLQRHGWPQPPAGSSPAPAALSAAPHSGPRPGGSGGEQRRRRLRTAPQLRVPSPARPSAVRRFASIPLLGPRRQRPRSLNQNRRVPPALVCPPWKGREEGERKHGGGQRHAEPLRAAPPAGRSSAASGAGEAGEQEAVRAAEDVR